MLTLKWSRASRC